VTHRRLVVIGAGPVGIAAALGAIRRGFETTVLEREAVGASLRRWGGVRLFSPLAMNVTPEMRAARGARMPSDDALLTGDELVDDVLLPLAESSPLDGRIRIATVRAVGRDRMRRGDHAGHPLRQERRFRILLEESGAERWLESDVVLDTSGLQGPMPALGPGGLPALGESSVPVVRDLGGVQAALPSLAARRVLLVGHGHSAAHAIRWLAHRAEVGTTVVWATRSAHLRPVAEVANDPLPERSRVATEANALAAAPPPWLRIERKAHVETLTPGSDGIEVHLSGSRIAIVDHVVALVGRRPDHAILSELAIEISPVTEGAARLSRALAHITDCLAVPSVAAHDFASGEASFHLGGIKSYGRSTAFLLRTGYAQLDTILDGERVDR
jgi:hypothetical protein